MLKIKFLNIFFPFKIEKIYLENSNLLLQTLLKLSLVILTSLYSCSCTSTISGKTIFDNRNQLYERVNYYWNLKIKGFRKEAWDLEIASEVYEEILNSRFACGATAQDLDGLETFSQTPYFDYLHAAIEQFKIRSLQIQANQKFAEVALDYRFCYPPYISPTNAISEEKWVRIGGIWFRLRPPLDQHPFGP